MIFYFSGTGNTRWAAQQLAAVTGERLLFIPDELKGQSTPDELEQSTSDELKGQSTYTLEADERIGFCFPVHGWQPPAIVRRFIRRLTIKNPQGHYCYALVTCGDSIGRTMEMLNADLATRGLHAQSLFSLVMPESYVCLPFMFTDSPEREQSKLSEADRQLSQIAEQVRNRVGGLTETKRGLTPWLFTHVIGAYFNGHMVHDRKFTVDSDVCIHCGRCQQVCPTGDVRLNADGVPTWQHDGTCTSCLACYHYCPKHAIHRGQITRKRGQYYFGHP
ncbi:MAG: EFR1 family ferrodoxin [Prevotella sp.]|nr:EFR1 family ferrodoxin [Prevotella sp.]